MVNDFNWKGPRPFIYQSKRALMIQIDEMRRKGVSWVAVALRLNQSRVRRAGHPAAWLPAGVRRFYHRAHPRPFRPYAPAPGPPRMREDCAVVARPCPFGACPAHMAELHIRIDAHDTRPESETMAAVAGGDFSGIKTCVLDLIDSRGPLTNSQIAKELRVSREQVRRMVNSAMDSAEAVDPEVGAELRRWYAYSSKIKGEKA